VFGSLLVVAVVLPLSIAALDAEDCCCCCCCCCMIPIWYNTSVSCFKRVIFATRPIANANNIHDTKLNTTNRAVTRTTKLLLLVLLFLLLSLFAIVVDVVDDVMVSIIGFLSACFLCCCCCCCCCAHGRQGDDVMKWDKIWTWWDESSSSDCACLCCCSSAVSFPLGVRFVFWFTDAVLTLCDTNDGRVCTTVQLLQVERTSPSNVGWERRTTNDERRMGWWTNDGRSKRSVRGSGICFLIVELTRCNACLQHVCVFFFDGMVCNVVSYSSYRVGVTVTKVLIK